MQDAQGPPEGARQGDLAAFDALYDEFSRLVYAIALRVLQNEAAAEDVTQGVFLKVWLAPAAFRGGNFRGWIARVARNHAIDVLRTTLAERPALTEIPCDSELDDHVFVRVEADRAREAITTLPAAQRSAIELAFFAGLTYPEIAQQTSAPLGTVKTRIRNGLRTVRAALGGEVAT